MADDWDLFAVVRSCTNSAATDTTAASSTSSSTPTRVNNRELGEPFVNLPSFQHDDIPFYFPGVMDDKDDSFQGLEEIYKELYSDTRQSPNPSGPVPGKFQNPPKIQAPQRQVQPHVQPQQVVQRQNQHLNLRHGTVGSSISFPSTSQPVRLRRRKNQQTKTVHQMTQEELSADSWAWRKYGQKPIKGSPYPRNYYRCSTSKGCSARKQVERCPTDPNIFVVSYSGEHTHPRPTHRSSLAGSTRSKLSPAAKHTSSSARTSIAAPITSSSASASSFSPSSTSIMGGESEGEENNTDEGPYIENDNAEMSGNIDEEEEEGNDEEDILIPNSFITDDILKGFQELSGGGTNGSDSSGAIADKSSCSLLSPPWTPTSSTTTTTNNNNFAAGGGC